MSVITFLFEGYSVSEHRLSFFVSSSLLYTHADISIQTSELLCTATLGEHSSTSVLQVHFSCFYFLSCLGFGFMLRTCCFNLPNPRIMCLPSLFFISWQCLSTTLHGSHRSSGWPWMKASGTAPWHISRMRDRKHGALSPTCLSMLGKCGQGC